MIGDDLAGQDGPLFNPVIYQRLVKPRHKRLVQYIRSRTKAKIWYHTCGACQAYIPELIDNGINILNPVQTSAKHMDPRELKQKFGRSSSSGAAVAIRNTSCRSPRPSKSPPMSARMSKSSSPAAGTSLTTSATTNPLTGENNP